jgi:hypothetical protein
MLDWGTIAKVVVFMLLTSGMNECTDTKKRVGNSPRYWKGMPDPTRDTAYHYLDSVYKARLAKPL